MSHPAIELITEPPAPPTESPRAVLWIGEGLHVLDADGGVLGRSTSCDVVVDYANVSRRHAWIRAVAGAWALHDLDSTNGVRLNGARIDGPQWLRHGDMLNIGSAEVKFMIDAPRGDR